MSEIIRFGVFELDLPRKELRRKGIRIKLQQQPFEILRLLVESRGELVSRTAIQKTLWPEEHFVDFERSINTAVMRLRYALRDNADSPAYIETVARTGYRLIPPVLNDAPASTKNEIRAIAILPLQDLSGTLDGQNFVDGLTDALVAALSVHSNLRVVSRSNMARYKDSHLSVRQIAKEVDVQALVEGSILRSGDRIRISARLLDAMQDSHLWARTYERDLKDILLLQEEIATAIVGSATAVFKRNSSREAPRPINPRAYELYLRGNFMMSSRAPSQMTKAAECYENAIFLEPQWALPHAMLADNCRMQAFYNYAASKQLLARTYSLTKKALRVDPNNAFANAIGGVLLAVHEWKWRAGLDKIQMALRADPQSAPIEHIYSQVLLHMGRFDEALRHADAARSIDPSSLLHWSYRAQVLVFARRYAECLHETERLLEQNPEFAISIVNHAAALIETGRYHEAISYFGPLIAETNWTMAMVGRMSAHHRLGQAEAVKADLAKLERLYQQGICAPSIMAWGYLAAGNTEASFACVESAIMGHDSRLSLFFRLSQFDAIRDDQRFVRALRHMDLDA